MNYQFLITNDEYPNVYNQKQEKTTSQKWIVRCLIEEYVTL